MSLRESRRDSPLLLGSTLGSSERRVQVFGRGYVAALVAQRGQDALSAWLDGNAGEWASTTRASALLALRADSATLEQVTLLDEAGRRRYWEELNAYGVADAQVELVLRKLSEHGRAHAAVDLAAMDLRREAPFDPSLLADALGAAARTERDLNGFRATSYELGQLLDALEAASTEGRISSERVAQLEFVLLPIVDRHARAPRVLQQELARNPGLFVEAVGYAFRAEGEPQRELSNEDAVRAELAYRLLHNWRGVPGLQDGRVDPERLGAWVSSAREALSASGRAEVGDQLIGQVLSGAPLGEDGVWPAEAVRDLVETVESDGLDTGLYIGKVNSGGVITKDPLAGGELERSLVTHYEREASKLAVRWPRTAAVLRRLADSYRHDAEREDTDATLRHDLWG